MANVNKWIGVGNCCADPETRYAASGSAITNLTIACNDKYKDKQTGQTVDKTEFVRIVFFNRLAEIADAYLKKGSHVYVEGKLQTRKWQAQDGSDRYSTEIVANELQMLGSKDEGAKASQAPVKQQSNNGQANAPQAGAMDDFESSDIPF